MKTGNDKDGWGMNDGNEQDERLEKGENPFSADLIEKAQLVHDRITELREDLEKSVFVGASKDGLFLVALHGDGRPESVTLRLDLPEEEKSLFENEIFEALEDSYRCRMEQLEDGMNSIQREVNLGPDFKLPF